MGKALDILKAEPFARLIGVPRELFARLKTLVGVKAVSSALTAVEDEIIKVEKKAKPLTYLTLQGSLAVKKDRLANATDDLESAVDMSKDYLEAAREQVQGITDQQTEEPEAAALSTRLTELEARLEKAAAILKKSKDKQELEQRKAALLNKLPDTNQNQNTRVVSCDPNFSWR